MTVADPGLGAFELVSGLFGWRELRLLRRIAPRARPSQSRNCNGRAGDDGLSQPRPTIELPRLIPSLCRRVDISSSPGGSSRQSIPPTQLWITTQGRRTR